MHHPGTRTTTETISWRWPCGATCKMERQVTISCPLHAHAHAHGCRCRRHGTPSAPAGHQHHHPHHRIHHHHHHQEEGTRALPVEEEEDSQSQSGRPAVMNIDHAEFWVPDPYLMVQQLRELESLNDEAVALRVQLEEYWEEIDRTRRERDTGGHGRSWFLALPDNIRNVLAAASDAIDTYIAAISTPPAK